MLQPKQKKEKDYHGRIYVFTQTATDLSNDYRKIKEIIEQAGGDLNEIKVDGKPYLQALMKKIVGDQRKPPFVFFNDEYIGGLENVRALKESGALEIKIQTCKNALHPGELYKVYRKQADLFIISPDHLYFPPPTNRPITCIFTLYNRTDKYTAFKLKTTFPNRYNVKPKKGFAPPNGSVVVEITMQKPLTEDEKGDRFRVESLALLYYKPEMEDMIDELFKEAEAKRIIKQNITCRFEHPPSGFSVSNIISDGSVIVQKNQNSFDMFDGFPVEAFAANVKKQIEGSSSVSTRVAPVSSNASSPSLEEEESVETHPVDSMHTALSTAVNETIFETPRGNESNAVMSEESDKETEKSPRNKSDSDEEATKLDVLKNTTDKILTQRNNQKIEASKGLEELYKMEFNRLEKEYSQLLNKLKSSEQRVKEYEVTIDEMNVKLRNAEQALQKELERKKIEVTPAVVSNTDTTLETQNYSLMALIAVALICLLIGKLM